MKQIRVRCCLSYGWHFLQPEGHRPCSCSPFIQAEIALHVTVESAADLASAIETLRTAAQSLGLDSHDRLWPRSSAVCLMAFCKGVGSCSRKEIAHNYTSAALLLSCMDASEVRAQDLRFRLRKDCLACVLSTPLATWSAFDLLTEFGTKYVTAARI